MRALFASNALNPDSNPDELAPAALASDAAVTPETSPAGAA